MLAVSKQKSPGQKPGDSHGKRYAPMQGSKTCSVLFLDKLVAIIDELSTLIIVIGVALFAGFIE